MLDLDRRSFLRLGGAAAAGAVIAPEAAPAATTGRRRPRLSPVSALPRPVRATLRQAMAEAVAEARQAIFPFGAVLVDVDTGAIVARGHNTVGTDHDPSAHAEVVTMRTGAAAGVDLRNTVLVTSAESCPMCASCAVWAGVAGVAYGTSIAYLIRHGWQQIRITQPMVVAQSFSRMPVVGGVLRRETDPLYADGPPRT
jgi:tRNA(Arg) A34 adenosine deaminase TadA